MYSHFFFHLTPTGAKENKVFLSNKFFKMLSRQGGVLIEEMFYSVIRSQVV
jgi:hypothetical protein